MSDSPPDPQHQDQHQHPKKKKNRPPKKAQSQSEDSSPTNTSPSETKPNTNAKAKAKASTKLSATAQDFTPSLMVPSSVVVPKTRAGRPSKKMRTGAAIVDTDTANTNADGKEKQSSTGQAEKNKNKKKNPPPKQNQTTDSTKKASDDCPDVSKESLVTSNKQKQKSNNKINKNKNLNLNKSSHKNTNSSAVTQAGHKHNHEQHNHNHNHDEEEEAEQEQEEGELCLLCAEVVVWAAVGRCNHPICHLCALRMRVKNNDKSCPVCKVDSAMVIVYKSPSSSSTVAITFESFHLDIHALDSPLPGVEVLPQAQMLYVDAHASFAEAGRLLALSCPECHARCRSDKALQQHVKEKHGLQFCQLCYTHRPLFTSEMRLMTAPQLQAHMQASVASSSSSSSEREKERGGRKKTLKAAAKQQGEDVAAGHQFCRFCSTYFYDTQDLYVHMRDEHFTCHLCPAAANHRFYKHLSDLLQHLSSTHFLCSLCLSAQVASSTGLTDHGAGVVAFKRQSEYAEHMLSSHSIKSASSSYSSLSSHIQASFSVKPSSSSSTSSAAAATPGYLDLQFSSSDPYNVAPEDIAPPPPSRRQQTQNRRHAPTAASSASEAIVSRDDLNDFPLPPQAQQYPSLGSSTAASKSKSKTKTSCAGGSSGSNQPSTGSASTATAPHPLSLTHKIAERKRAAAAVKEDELRQKEIQKAFEARRELRNTAFADALGLGSKSLMQTVRVSAAANGSNGSNSSSGSSSLEHSTTADVLAIEQHVYDSLAKVPLFYELFRPENPQGLVHVPKELSLSSSAKISHLMTTLRRPLYSTELIAWSKNHRMDLIKVEKKIQELLADESATSCQLKPMKKWSLESVGLLAKYYGLNSQQFFSTNTHSSSNSRHLAAKEGAPAPPTQYLSLIKTADSTPPATLLSAAALPYTLSAQYAQDVATTPQQVELQELLRVRENMDSHGVLHPTLYFLVNTKKHGAGCTVGDFICQIKALAEVKCSTSSKSRCGPRMWQFSTSSFVAPVVAPDDRIIELVCIGNGLIKVSLNTFAAAKSLLEAVTSGEAQAQAHAHATASASASALSSQWDVDSPHAINSNSNSNSDQLLTAVSLADKFFISAHFSEEDIEFATLMDEQVEEDFRTQQQQQQQQQQEMVSASSSIAIATEKSDVSPPSHPSGDHSDGKVEHEVVEGDGDDGDDDSQTLDEWDSYTPEHMERVSQSLAEKRTALQVQELEAAAAAAAAQQRQRATAARSQAQTQALSTSSTRPDMPTLPMRTLSVFSRQRLPAPTARAHALAEALTSTAAAVDHHALPPDFSSVDQSSSKNKSRGKISVHKFSAPSPPSPPVNNSGLYSIPDGEILDEAEAHELRAAIAASLREAELREAQTQTQTQTQAQAQKEYVHLDIAPRTISHSDPPADMHTAPDTHTHTHTYAASGGGEGGGGDGSRGEESGLSALSALSLFGRGEGRQRTGTGTGAAGLYQAPRGSPPASSSATATATASAYTQTQTQTQDEHSSHSHSHNPQEPQGSVIESLREPIVVPQQLKQSVTYPVRYTFDRRNHRQQVQNSFSVLQNGEIDTYYHSEDEDDEEEKEKEAKEEDDGTKKNAEIA